MNDASFGVRPRISIVDKVKAALEPAVKLVAIERRTNANRNAAKPTNGSTALDYVVVPFLVLGAALVSEFWVHFFNHPHRNLGMPFMIAVIITGAWFGTRPALVAAVLSFATYRYFLTDPLYSLTLDSADALPLLTFSGGAVLVGALAGRLSDRARSAADRLRRLTVLFGVSRDLSAAANRSEVARRLAARLETDVGLASAVFAEANGAPIFLARSPSSEKSLASAAVEPNDERFERLPLRTSRGEVGAILYVKPAKPLGATDREWLHAIAQLGAIALDRATLATEISEARLIAEREGLRTALLSSLSHDLRTPLATILASASSLADAGDKFDEPTRRDLLETIQTQTDRLNRYVANLLDMTRLETGALVLKCAYVDPTEAVASAVEHLSVSLQKHVIVRCLAPIEATIFVDPLLFEQALVNILDNAIKFGPPGSRIEVGVRLEGHDVVLWIADEGPGISASELSKIFDKFFRGNPDGGQHAGVGLGLAVVRGIIEAFGGKVSAESPVSAGRGTRFSLRLSAHGVLESIW